MWVLDAESKRPTSQSFPAFPKHGNNLKLVFLVSLRSPKVTPIFDSDGWDKIIKFYIFTHRDMAFNFKRQTFYLQIFDGYR